jgi:hypothetical protein
MLRTRTSRPLRKLTVAALNSYGLGTVTVKCSYTDAGNLSDSDEVSYKIVDTKAPVLTVPSSPVVVEATTANGATVNFASEGQRQRRRLR